MAIYTMQVKTISRSNGHSATAKIAYNCRDKITDLRTGEIHKYNSKKMAEDLVYSEITCKDLTLDKKERSEIWNNAELAENRKDSRTAREYVVALPKELSVEQNIKLVREFAQELTTKHNNVADWAIHNEKDSNGNIHAHILTTTREFNPESKQLGERTAIEWNNTKCQKNNVPVTQEQIKGIRKDWEIIQNKHLAMAGLDLAVSCERKEDRETVKKHLGKEAVALERQGIETELGNYNRTIDNVVQLERQIYSDGSTLANEHAELKRLELQKLDIERQQRIDEQLKNQLELARQSELIRLERLQQEQAKQAEEKKKAGLKAKEQEEIARLKVPADNCITAQRRYKLFDIAREHKEFFTQQTTGEYKYWTSRNGDIDVHRTHINVNKPSDESIKLALDIAVSQFGDKLSIYGNDDFIKATIDIIANTQRYAKISLDKPELQEMLDSKRLDIEIAKAVDLNLDNIPDLDISNAPDLNLDRQKPQKKQELEHGHSHGSGWDMSR
jgi:hypothetical protein